ncbi:MAG: hypothetical protein II767_00165 [Proteobacteria bacterium]|nr:hypothetical protein [Pseudomonadota bacterium]
MHIPQWPCSLILSTTLLCLAPLSAFASPNPHDIILRLASETFAPQIANQLQFLTPKGWNLRTDGNDLSFHVPYHPGILGHIIQNNALSPDEFLKDLEKTYHAEFSEISRSEAKTDHLQGNKLLLNGQFGGETYTILLFTGKLDAQMDIAFYAIAPSHWFQSYEPLFLDILNSLHK